MNNTVKKVCIALYGMVFLWNLAFAAVTTAPQVVQIKPKAGYINGITWGMKQLQVKAKLESGARWAKVEKSDTRYKAFRSSVVIYVDKRTGTDFYFDNDKLFYIRTELTNPNEITEEKLKQRFADIEAFSEGNTKGFWDKVVADDGRISQSIQITYQYNKSGKAYAAVVELYNRSLLRIASMVDIPEYDESVASGYSAQASLPSVIRDSTVRQVPSATIDKALENLAQKLVQTSLDANPVYAFVALTSDDGNALVENYVTDALAEAMFNTGKIRVVERTRIEKILGEQMFQTSALVNENTAVDIGNLSGAHYVCYGTIKDLGKQLTINARVVEVSSAEICAMGRETIPKDKYLQNVGYEARQTAGNNLALLGSGSNSQNTTAAKPASVPAKQAAHVKSAWEVRKNNNGIYTTYTFILKCSGQPFLFVGYDKYDIPTSSRVKAGIYWINSCADVEGKYDMKEDSGNVTTKSFSWAWWTYDVGYGHAWAHRGVGAKDSYWASDEKSSRKIDGLAAFAFTCNKGESARSFVNLFANNKTLVVRHNNESFRFATEGFWQTVGDTGLTQEEIMDAIANEEF